MRTNIEIDEALLRKAMRLSGAKTKRAAVDQALRYHVRRLDLQRAFERVQGTGWQGDLAAMRRTRRFPKWGVWKERGHANQH